MADEIETKLKVDSHEQVAQKLKELGAEFVSELLQEDHYFDSTDSSMVKSDKCLRIRSQTINGSEKVFIAYKGPKKSGSLKRRLEVEFEVSDRKSAAEMFSALGYYDVLTVEKQRRLWLIDDCEVVLDKLAMLGDFIEIEGPNEETIMAVQKKLGLGDIGHVPDSYACLVRQQIEASGKEADSQ